MTWRVGDLAACVDASSCGHCGGDIGVDKGVVYRVARVKVSRRWFCRTVLLLVDGERVGLHVPGVPAKRFRKIIPDKHEQCEPEFVTLLKRIKRTVPASAMSAFGQDAEERLEAKPASATGEAGDAQ